MLGKYDMSLGAGLSKLAGRIFRIGHLGECTELTLIGALSGVEMGLDAPGVPYRRGGVLAAMSNLIPGVTTERHHQRSVRQVGGTPFDGTDLVPLQRPAERRRGEGTPLLAPRVSLSPWLDRNPDPAGKPLRSRRRADTALESDAREFQASRRPTVYRESLLPEFQDFGTISSGLAADGFVYLGPDAMRGFLGSAALPGWPHFAESWSALERDAFMGDGGAYRRRRHAVFQGTGSHVERQPDRPHYQEKTFNQLNGGIARRFAAVTADVADNPLTQRLLTAFLPAFDRSPASARPSAWDIELHQFRIEVRGQDHGLPTPEGLHRDGVDWVVMMLVGRENVTGGLTTIVDEAGTAVSQLQMRQPFETIIVDDHRFRHGVSPLTAVDPTAAGHRDVLVMTYSAR